MISELKKNLKQRSTLKIGIIWHKVDQIIDMKSH